MKSAKFAPRPNPIYQPIPRPLGLDNARLTPNEATRAANALLRAEGMSVKSGQPRSAQRMPELAPETRATCPQCSSLVLDGTCTLNRRHH